MLLSQFIELAATFTECLLVLLTTVTVSGTRFNKKTNILLSILFSFFSMLVVAILNQWRAFSYITPLAAMVTIIFISSWVISTGSLLIRSIACILSYLVVQCIDYIVIVLCGHFVGNPDNFFTLFVTIEGINRGVFLVIDKSIDVILFILLRTHLVRLSKLTLRLQRYLLFLSIVSYVFMQCLFQAVLVPNLGIMQLAVVASWCFLIGFIIAFIAFFLALTKQEQDRQRMEMLHSENILMAENYKTLHSTQQTYARTLHDFKHHVTALRDLVSADKPEAAIEYMDSLLKSSYQMTTQCHSGNDIVDAIINSKLAEAQAKDIQFTFMANLHIPIKIDPVDLCGVLANQLENAFEACTQIYDPTDRLVHAEIKQAQSFVILRVENSVLSNPFADNPRLISTKKVSPEFHGYGLLNIRSIAQKYEGTLRTEFTNNKFVSVVTLCDIPFNTNNSTIE